MKILAIDTSGPFGSLATARIDGKIVFDLKQVSWNKRSAHSEFATIHLEQIIRDSNFKLSELTHIVVNIGPGSFTGIRVGLSMAKSLAYALEKPLLGINSLESLAYANGPENGKILVALKAVQNFYYCATFENSAAGFHCVREPNSALDSDLTALSADCGRILIETQTPGFSANSQAKDLINMVTHSHPRKTFFTWKSVEPLYIRGSEAEEKLKRGILKPLL